MANSITKLSEKCFRVLLDPIAANATVSIGFSDSGDPAPDLAMVAPNWGPYTRPDGSLITLQDAVQVSNPTPTTDVNAAIPVSVTKQGESHDDFVIQVHNDNAGGGAASGALELYIEWAGH